MAYEIRVGPTEPRPTHHISLTDGVSTVGLILCDARGNVSENIDREPVPREAVKTYQGEQKHSDLAGPYRTIAQETFTGGRGMRWFEDDKSRYYDGIVDSTMEGKLILPPMVQYADGIRNADNYMPDEDHATYVWVPLYGSSKYITRQFTTGSGYTCKNAEVYMRKVGAPSDPGFRLKNDNAGAPGTVKATFVYYTKPSGGVGEQMPRFYYSAGTVLSGSTPYWFEVYGGTTSDADNHWEVLCDLKVSSSQARTSSDGSSYTNSTYWVYGRVTDNQGYREYLFAEYKGAVYCASKPDDRDYIGYLFMNGDRGAADSNSANMARLNDATKSWTADYYNNAIVEITKGRGYEEDQNWRDITDTASTYLTCNPFWEVIHNAGGSNYAYTTEYVIKRTPHWKQINITFNEPITDIQVAGSGLYIAQGGNQPIWRYWEGVDRYDGAWDVYDAADREKADLLEMVVDPERGDTMYWFRNDDVFYDGACWVDNVPNSAFEYFGRTAKILEVWFWTENYKAANVSVTRQEDGVQGFGISTDFTTGLAYVCDCWQGVDVRQGEYFVIGIAVTKDIAAGVLQILLDDDSLCASPTVTIDCPALRAGIVNHIEVDYDLEQNDDAEFLRYVGFNITTDQDKAISFTPYYVYACQRFTRIKITKGGANYITGTTTYGEPEAVWAFTERGFGEIRNGVYQTSPLSKQINSVRNRNNGRNPLAHDVYLYFPLGENGGYQRYYQNVLDSIGLDQDEGLPYLRRGAIHDAVSYGGKIFVCVNGRYYNHTSAIYCYSSGGWHEFYRAPRQGLPIRNLFVQPMPGPYPDRLWFSMGADVCWLDLDLNPLQNYYYRYSHVGYLMTGYIHVGMLDVNKLFTSIKTMSDNLDNSTPKREITIEYRLNTTTAWTKLDDTFDVSPSQELVLSDDNDVAGKWIQFRFVFNNNYNTETMVLYSWAVELFSLAEIKFSYRFTFRLADNDQNLCDMYEGKPGDGAGADEKAAILDGWITNRTALTMSSVSTMENNKDVIPTGLPLRRLAKIYDEVSGKDVYIAQLNLLEA